MSTIENDTTMTSTDAATTPMIAATSAPPSRPSPKQRNWRKRFSRRLLVSDLFVLVWVVFGAQIVWFGTGNVDLAIHENAAITDVSYWMFSAGLVLLWMWALSLIDSRSERVIGTGTAEYVRVANSSITLFGFIAITAFLLKVEVARGYLLISLPAGILVLVFSRWMWRQWLIAHRSMNEYSARVLLVGSPDSVTQIARELERTPSAGYAVVGACTTSNGRPLTLRKGALPVLGGIDDVEAVLATTGADTVAVTSTDELPPDKVKQISWRLEAGKQHLVLAPSIVDIAGPRLHTRPVLAFLAISVRLSSEGPVFFRQTRVGIRGREFTMIKFRSMVVNAEELLDKLAEQQRDAGNEILFKMQNDPRVTPIGRIMRKFSLDELPQLFNVIGGSMSLVGPRPPLPSEVAKYADHVHRRFIVKPGITGLWQVSGRSTLSWEDSVRLDLSYVENWSLLTDVAIVFKTARAVLRPAKTAM